MIIENVKKKNRRLIQISLDKVMLLISILSLSFVSCQTKKVINYTRYEELTFEKKQEADDYLLDARKLMSNKESEIALMFQYNCFLDKSITVNNIYSKKFPKTDNVHYGQSVVNFSKKLGKIKVKISDGNSFSISQKKGFDYITICYNKSSETIYIHYYNFPKLLVEE
ncbi:hypothetical protein [Chryseobacterium sp. MYb328]|uniref:hypothetical protein n=1 Tax=Chryseobacterium sp. MYb328 TaxID=2745231 RepID=UPI0030AF7014